jgi:hypothetical protein
MKFISNVFKTFVSTLCYNNDENYDLLNVKCSSFKDVDGLNVAFTILHKIK